MVNKKKPTKCISVRLKALFPISEKAYKAIAFDGTSDLIPASEYFGLDTETTKSRGYWIAEWILKRKILQRKTNDPKVAWFDENRNRCAAPERIKRREPRHTTFTITYMNKRTDEKFKCKVISENEEAAKKRVMEKFYSENLEFNPLENGRRNEIEIVSIETRPGRNKVNPTDTN